MSKSVKFDVEIVESSCKFPLKLNLETKRFSQILFNLIQNAVKFNIFGGKISVKMSIDEGFNFLLTEVEDSGLGIDNQQ